MDIANLIDLENTRVLDVTRNNQGDLFITCDFK